MRTKDNGLRSSGRRNSGEGIHPRKRRTVSLRKPNQKITKISLASALKSTGTKTEDARGLKPVEAEIVKEYISNGGNKSAAVDTVGHNASTEMFKKPEVQKAILLALEKAGVTDEIIAQKIKQGLEATSVKIHEGSVVCEPPDWGVRHKYVETALKVRGDLGEGMNIQNANVSYNSFKDE